MKENRKKKTKLNKLFVIPFLILVIGFGVGTYFYSNNTEEANIVKKYYELINEKKYDQIYDLVETELSEEEFKEKIKNIYDGIESKDISISISSNTTIRKKKNEINETEEINQPVNISYKLSMKTVAGNIEFNNTIPVSQNGEQYKIIWNSSTIYPELENDEKIRVRNIEAKRGTIFDRNGQTLAKDSSVYDIGIIPKKIENKDDINKICNLLEIESNKIQDKLNSEKINKEDFISLKKISKEQQQVKNELLKIKGIVVNDADSRIYPYKEATSIMTGYIQDREGKTGLEYSFNDKLKGKDGIEIYIDKDGKIKKSIIKKEEKDGEDIKLTIDAEVQKKIYDEFKDEESTVVLMDYNSGEIKALVSTPSYDANKFCIGISQEEWEELQNNESKPMFNRYLASYTPGSTMKPLIGAIGLKSNAFTAEDDFGRSGKRWQKDSSWKGIWITTLKEYSEPANLENALIQSDNIYFAKAALKIGKNKLEENLNDFGFNSKLEFPQEIDISKYGQLNSETALANTGYGQAQVLVNPIFMSSIYSSFANGGNMMKPYIVYEEKEEEKVKIKNEHIISEEVAQIIKEDLIKVVENGSGKIEERTLAGKTGTAEIKANQSDKNGTENGWFDVFDETGNLYISMIQDVKERGGSKYVVEKIKKILE